MRRLSPRAEPHAAGTRAGAEVRARLVRELEEQGLEPEVQSGIACSKHGTCAELHNVVGRVRGTEPTLEVALVAHYDSVPSGPGAGDDAQGTASVIEIARALQAERQRAGVLLVFTDGEELGTLGARSFLAAHPLREQILAVINLEARGNRGPSLMFETTPGNAWLLERYAHAPRPVATSLFATVYRALPNDTDLSVFAEHGIQGLNFAFVGGVEHYHTPGDTLEALDLRSVQQQGDAALATARALLDHGLEPRGDDAVFFDLWSLWLVRLPPHRVTLVALLAVVLFALGVGRDLRRGARRGRDLGRAALGLLVAWALPVLVAAGLGSLLGWLGALPFPIVAQPLPLLLGLGCLALTGSAVAAALTDGVEPRLALWDVTWSCWLGLGAALALVLPAVSYLLVIPAACAALTRPWLSAERPIITLGLGLGCAAVAATLWLPVASLLYPTLGFTYPSLLALGFAITLSPFTPWLAPLLRGQRTRLGLAAASMALALGQLAFAPYSPQVPQRLSLTLEQDATGRALWHADASTGTLPLALRRAAAFEAEPSGHHPWPGYLQDSTYTAPAVVGPPHLPEWRLEHTGPASLRLYFDAPPELWALGVHVSGEPRLEHATWRGQRLSAESSGTDQRFLLVPGADRSLIVDLDFEAGTPDRIDLVAMSLGLPEAAQALIAARAPVAVASGMGDSSVLRIDAHPR